MIFLFSGIALMIPTVAAQTYRSQSGTTQKKAEPAKPEEAEQTMQKFSKCLLKSPARQKAVMQYLQLPNDDPEQGKRGAALTKSGCVPSGTRQMRFQPELFRYSLFSALYARYFKKKSPESLEMRRRLDFASEFDQSRAIVSKIELASRSFGDCVARRNPADSHSLLLTTIHSGSERKMISKISPDLSACVSDGIELKFSRTVIRGILAEAMYKLRFAANSSRVLEAQN